MMMTTRRCLQLPLCYGGQNFQIPNPPGTKNKYGPWIFFYFYFVVVFNPKKQFANLESAVFQGRRFWNPHLDCSSPSIISKYHYFQIVPPSFKSQNIALLSIIIHHTQASISLKSRQEEENFSLFKTIYKTLSEINTYAGFPEFVELRLTLTLHTLIKTSNPQAKVETKTTVFSYYS